MIVLFTDFGVAGPYLGQVKAVLWQHAPLVPVIDLFADAPVQRPRESAYLLAAYAGGFPPGCVFLGVVDPGVGGERRAVAARVDGHWLVGPDNGLFELMLRRGGAAEQFVIAPPSAGVSASFHGRDVFAPIAGRLAAGASPAELGLGRAPLRRFEDWPDDLAAVAYVDHYGNLITGLRASVLPVAAVLTVGGRRLGRARTFSDLPRGGAFWYENANGLAELAVNCGRADAVLGAGVGTPVELAVD